MIQKKHKNELEDMSMRKKKWNQKFFGAIMAIGLVCGVITSAVDIKAGAQQASSVHMSKHNNVFGFWAQGYYFDESYHKAIAHLIKAPIHTNTRKEVKTGCNYGYLAVYASSDTEPFSNDPYLAQDDFQSYMSAQLNLTK